MNSRRIKDLNVSLDTIKVLEENIDRKVSAIPCNNIFADTSSRARDIRARINKWEYIKASLTNILNEVSPQLKTLYTVIYRSFLLLHLLTWELGVNM